MCFQIWIRWGSEHEARDFTGYLARLIEGGAARFASGVCAVVSVGEFLPEGWIGGFENVEINGETVRCVEGIEDSGFV
jgi:hypothetical protein